MLRLTGITTCTRTVATSVIGLQAIFNMECVCMLMVYLPTKSNKSGSNDPLLVPMKLDDKANFRTSTTVYYILQHHPTSSYTSKMYYNTSFISITLNTYSIIAGNSVQLH